MTQQTLTRLRHLKLTGMADAVQQQLEQAEYLRRAALHRAAKPAGRTQNN